MLTLLVALVALCLIGWIARAIRVGLNGPPWIDAVIAGVLCLIALVMVANAFGIPTPALR